ncbi:MAG: hypothetical protein A2Y25_06495 [Candidatus Melainabacteria bacterium GWF2_37_15]|nr:MAG: hypothetical protein A2Y25_06495 [Candidatus Melainabacteria bacterium GWF2_37_15]
MLSNLGIQRSQVNTFGAQSIEPSAVKQKMKETKEALSNRRHFDIADGSSSNYGLQAVYLAAKNNILLEQLVADKFDPQA